MLTPGQLGIQYKKRYVENKKTHPLSDESVPLPGSYKETPDPHLKSPNIIEEIPPPEYFQYKRNKLYLNPETMITDSPLFQSKQEDTQDQKNSPSKKDIAVKKLEDLADKSGDVLLKVSTVFPFTLFKNDIIVDPYKVNVVFREFFYSEHIHSIMVKDILDVVVETSLFFATVKIVDQGYTENSVNVAYLKKEEALKLRKLIQGLVIAHRQAVDLSIINPIHIKDKAEQLGEVKGIDDTKQNLNQR